MAGGLYRTYEVPRSTDALRAFCEAGRNEHMRNYDTLSAIVPVLRDYLKRSVPGGPVVSALIARQVVKPLKDAAAWNHDTASAFLRAWHVYEMRVLNTQDKGAMPFKI